MNKAKKSMLTLISILALIASSALAESDLVIKGTPLTHSNYIVHYSLPIKSQELLCTRRGYARRLKRATTKRHNPAAPLVSCWPIQALSKHRASLLVLPEIGSNKTVITSSNVPSTQGVPPDTMGAVGPKQYIVALNNGIRTFDKITLEPDHILDISLTAFFNERAAIIGDPRIRFDHHSQRWFVTAISVFDEFFQRPAPNVIYIAVSDGAVITPCTKWNIYTFREDLVEPQGDRNLFADFDTLGIDEYNLYMGTDQFRFVDTEENFISSTVYIFKKQPMIEGRPAIATAYRNLTNRVPGTGIVTPQGVDNFDQAPQHGYFIGPDFFTFGKLIMHKVLNPQADHPTLSGPIPLTVPSTNIPIKAPHKGNLFGEPGLIDTLDDRLQMAHIRNNQLFTVQGISVNANGIAPKTDREDPTVTGDRSALRWYHIDVSGENPQVQEVGTIWDPAQKNPRFFYFPAIMTNAQGALTISSTVSSAKEFINVAITGRPAGSTTTQLSFPRLVTQSRSSFNFTVTDPEEGQRYGDYSFTSWDSQDDSMWTIQQFTAATDVWGLQVTQLFGPAS